MLPLVIYIWQNTGRLKIKLSFRCSFHFLDFLSILKWISGKLFLKGPINGNPKSLDRGYNLGERKFRNQRLLKCPLHLLQHLVLNSSQEEHQIHPRKQNHDLSNGWNAFWYFRCWKCDMWGNCWSSFVILWFCIINRKPWIVDSNTPFNTKYFP